MSKNTNRGRGRPRKELTYPQGKFTVNTLAELNPQIQCRLSLYTRVDELVAKRIIRYTGNTIKTGGVGKPMFEFQTMASYRNSRAQKRNAKLRKLAKAAPVSLTSAPVPVTA